MPADAALALSKPTPSASTIHFHARMRSPPSSRLACYWPSSCNSTEKPGFCQIVARNIQEPGNGCPKSEQDRQRSKDMTLDFPHLRQELESRVRARTGGRLRKLDIQLSPDGIVLHGETTTYHVKQLAQHGVRDLLPT